MRILMVGLGSIGQRHLRNLGAILGRDAEFLAYRVRGNWQSIAPGAGLRTGSDVEQEFRVRVFHELEEALAQKPDCAFVCNPSSLHLPVAIAAARAGCHLFIEKPLSHTMDGVDELLAEVRRRSTVAMVGFQFRFHPGLMIIKDMLERDLIGRILSVHAHWGEYLPGWHPYEDFRGGYAARADLGGGVILTLCHPLDYLRWMLGDVREVRAMTARSGSLELDVEDTAEILLRFESGCVGAVHLDYVQRPPSHTLRLTGEKGVILWDNADGLARWFLAETGTWSTGDLPPGFERNTMFMSEARHFLDCVAGTDTLRSGLEDGVKALELALAARTAAARGIPEVLT